MNIKFFTLREMCSSNTATANKLSNIPSWDIVRNLERLCFRLDKVRLQFGNPITVTSGYRSRVVNELVGGSPNSFHIVGLAADISAPNILDLYDVVKQYNWRECYINKAKHYIHVAI